MIDFTFRGNFNHFYIKVNRRLDIKLILNRPRKIVKKFYTRLIYVRKLRGKVPTGAYRSFEKMS